MTEGQKGQSAVAECRFDECRYCVHRVNARRTPDRMGQCDLELRGRLSARLCRGKVFFSPSPDHAAKYRNWVIAASSRA